MQTAIEAQQLTKIFAHSKKRPETIAVDSIELAIQKGEIFGLLGAIGWAILRSNKMMILVVAILVVLDAFTLYIGSRVFQREKLIS